MAKNSQNASPTPAWTMRQQQQPPESYQYSQLSPSRSPSGPTYTQLSSGINSRPAYNATATTQQAPHQPGEFLNCNCLLLNNINLLQLCRIFWMV